MELIFELSSLGRKGYSLPKCDVPQGKINRLIPSDFLRDRPPNLPEVSEIDIVRHFTKLSQLNYAVDVGFYPLGSCTMKYNPKLNDAVASLPGFARSHPYQPEELSEGILQIFYELEQLLCEICGMAAFSLQPAAGAHGEFLGIMMIHAYHLDRGDEKRTRVLIPDSAHGTNPASAARCGYEVITIPSNEKGEIDLDALKANLNHFGHEVAALMLTNPNTFGLFETNILEISELVHQAGALMYADGANMNALLGLCRPGDMGFDVMHLNLHKTFSTPHGGGGPGAGPVGVSEKLVDFLPLPKVVKEDNKYKLNYDFPKSIGKVRAFYGNSGVLVRAYTYIKALGAEGLKQVSYNAILNANYLRRKLENYYHLPRKRTCMHEVVFSAKNQKAHSVSALDVAKRLLDFGFHAPTIYFPNIISGDNPITEALMIEPTETESKQTLDRFIEAMIQIDEEAKSNPDLVKGAPYTTPVSRLDEVTAARKPNVKY